MSEGRQGTTRDDVEALRCLLERHARLVGDFELSSGVKSRFYFDGKRVTLSPRGSALVGRILEPIVAATGAGAVGGLAIGADPIALAVAVESDRTGTNIPAFIVRPEKKGHGTRDAITSSFPVRESHADSETHHIQLIRPGLRVVVVDDVVTTGASIQKAIDVLKEAGCEVEAVVTLVTRPEGGETAQALRRDYRYISLYECDEEGNLATTSEAEALFRSAVA